MHKNFVNDVYSSADYTVFDHVLPCSLVVYCELNPMFPK